MFLLGIKRKLQHFSFPDNKGTISKNNLRFIHVSFQKLFYHTRLVHNKSFKVKAIINKQTSSIKPATFTTNFKY